MAALEADLGDDVVLHAEFRTLIAGVETLTDPTGNTCTVTVADPDGTVTDISGTVTRISQGVYEAVFTPTVAGGHWYRFEGAGAAKGAEEDSFTVRKRRVPAP